MNSSLPTTVSPRTVSLSWRNLTLRTKLIIVLLVSALIPLAVITWANARSNADALTEDANRNLLGSASAVASKLDFFVRNNLDNVRGNAQLSSVVSYTSLPADQRAGSAEEARVLAFMIAESRTDPVFITSIAIMDAQGVTLVDTSTKDIGTDRSDRFYFQKVLETNLPYASSVEYDRTTGKPSLYFAAPVRSVDNTIIGVLRIRYDAHILQEFLTADTGLSGLGSFPVLLDENLVRLAHGTNRTYLAKSVVPLAPELVSQLQQDRLLPPGSPEELSTNIPAFASGLKNYETQPFFLADLTGTGTNEQAAAVHLATQPWLVVFAQSQAAFLEPINTQVRNSLLIALGVSIVIAFFGIVVSQSISGPIVRLTHTAEDIASGNINVQAAVETGDEIGTLARTFNTMTAQLREFIGSLEQRVAERTKAIATSSAVSRRLSTILDRSQLVTEVVEQVKDAFDYYHAHIYLYDSSKEELIMAGGTGEAGAAMMASGHRVQKGRGLVGRAAESNQVVLVADTTQDPDWLPNPLLPETKAEVAIPISIGDDVVGVLDVQHSVTGGLDQEDVDSLSSIANQVAVALQNIQQYQNTQKVATDLSVVANVGIATATITETDRLLQEVVDLSKQSFNLYHVHIYLLNEAGDTLMLASGAGEVGRQMVSEGRSIPMDSEQSLVARAARTKEGVVVNDVTTTPDFLPNPLLPKTRAEMAVPMIVAGRVIGVLDVQSEIVGRFTEVDVNIKTTLASQIAVALENARSFQITQKHAERQTKLNLITQKIQNATTIEEAMQVAARELGHALGKRQTLVALDPAVLSGAGKAVTND